MDIGNHQALKLQARIKELEEANSQLKTELADFLKDPFTKYKSKDISPCNHTAEHIQEDIEGGRSVATCFVHCYYWCPKCVQAVHDWGENEIPNAHIGPKARAQAAFLRYEIKISYDDIQRTLQYLCGLNIVPGSIAVFDNKLAQKAEPFYEELKQSLRKTSYICADETGWKRNWMWIFTNPEIAFFHIDESRGSKVVVNHLGGFYNGILITDFWNAYRNKVGAFAKQKCIVHLLRDIKELLKIENIDEETKCFLLKVKTLFKDAIFIHHMHSIFSAAEYRSACKDIRQRFKKLRSNPNLEHHETDNIRKRLITFKDELLVFLKYPLVSPTNNFAEQGIRNAVLFRKITFGNMTKRGKRNVSIIMTIIRTAMLRKLNPLAIIQKILLNDITAMPEAP